jgi:putative nucleotidyltransferase with HDIG domain
MPIARVRDAVTFIGTGHIAALVAAIEVFESLGRHISPEMHAHYELLWDRSLHRATIAKKIAEDWKENLAPQLVYIAALLQDIGLLIRLSSEPERYMQMIQLIHDQSVSPSQAELQTFSNMHQDVGAYICQLWNFPPEIVFAIAHHHTGTFDDPLTQMIQIADALYTPDMNNPHDKEIDPLVEIWRSRFDEL